jgi:hypothetical protein
MSREAHVQFCESLGVRFPGATHPYLPIREGLPTIHPESLAGLFEDGLRDIREAKPAYYLCASNS